MEIKWLWIGLGTLAVTLIALLAKALINISGAAEDIQDHIDGCA
jgi:hypothetical protein